MAPTRTRATPIPVRGWHTPRHMTRHPVRAAVRGFRQFIVHWNSIMCARTSTFRNRCERRDKSHNIDLRIKYASRVRVRQMNGECVCVCVCICVFVCDQRVFAAHLAARTQTQTHTYKQTLTRSTVYAVLYRFLRTGPAARDRDRLAWH